MYRTILTGFALLLALSGTAFAASSVSTSTGLTAAGGPLAIHGYDPVSYFLGSSPARGVAKFSTLHKGAAYRFASKENQQAFEANPEKYAPQFGGFCAYGASVGKKFDGDPDVYRIVDGQLYFNLNPEIKKTWEKDLAKNIKKAEANWPKIKDTAASDL